VVFFALWLTIGTAGLSAQEPSAPIRIAGAAYMADATTTIAEATDAFADQSVDAIVERYGSGKEALARLRSGEADFALTALTPLVLDRLADLTPREDADPVIIATLVHSPRLMQIVYLGESGGRDPNVLAGQRIGLAAGTNSELLWWLFTHVHDIDSEESTVVDLTGSEMFNQLLAGDIDAAVLWQPWLARLQDRLATSSNVGLHTFDTRYLYSAQWALVTTRRMIRLRPERVRRILAAYRQATEYIEREPDAALALYARREDIDPERLDGYWNALDYDLNLDWTLIGGLQEQFLWATTHGYSNRGGPVQVLDLIDSRPLRSRWPESVRIPRSPDDEARP
jgi:ABC-type nitrate/sulfonate/bicarbonate transport system substrate-binding protein